MPKYPDELAQVVRSVRTALEAAETSERERAQFLYDLVREVYDHVKFDVGFPAAMSVERERLGAITDAALPPYGEFHMGRSGKN